MCDKPAPSSAADANNKPDGEQPGRPYYESVRTNLRATLDKKRRLEEQLASLEDSIFKQETQYLEETAASGNIVKGFDGYVKNVSIGRNATDDRRRGRVRDEDRIFSKSSVSWMKAQEGSDSALPSHAPTPTTSFAPALSARESNAAAASVKAPNKKKRPNDKDDENEGKTSKRGKITFDRD